MAKIHNTGGPRAPSLKAADAKPAAKPTIPAAPSPRSAVAAPIHRTAWNPQTRAAPPAERSEPGSHARLAHLQASKDPFGAEPSRLPGGRAELPAPRSASPSARSPLPPTGVRASLPTPVPRVSVTTAPRPGISRAE